MIEPSIAEDDANAFVPVGIAQRLATLLRSLGAYELLSNGVQSEVRQIADRIASGPDDAAVAAAVEHLDDDGVLAEIWFDVVKIFKRRRLEPALSFHRLPYPHYPIGEQQGTDGVTAPGVMMWDPAPVPEASPRAWKVLGYEVGFPIGIPSCELTRDADWVESYARKGFHVLTYRTVRNTPKPGSAYDWVYVEGIAEPWTSVPDPHAAVRHAEGSLPPDWRRTSTATSYVAPCEESWEADVAKARRRLKALGGGHLLIVSVTDSVPKDEKSIETLSADFVEVALKAERAGAQAVECYLARATIKDDTGELKPCERSVETSIAIVEAVRSVLDTKTRLLIKLSADLAPESLEMIVVDLARRGLIDGVSGISPIEVERVTTGDDDHTLWEQHRSGVAGYALRHLSQRFVERLAALRERESLEFDIIAMGGVMTAEDVALYLRLGASAVQTATAAVLDPSLADVAYARYKTSVQTKKTWDGVVMEVDEAAGRFWARIAASDGSTPDMDAQFELDEVHRDQRRTVREGALFCWTSGLVEMGRRRYRHSTVQFRSVDPPTEDQLLAGKRLAEGVAEVFAVKPDVA